MSIDNVGGSIDGRVLNESIGDDNSFVVGGDTTAGKKAQVGDAVKKQTRCESIDQVNSSNDSHYEPNSGIKGNLYQAAGDYVKFDESQLPAEVTQTPTEPLGEVGEPVNTPDSPKNTGDETGKSAN